MEYAHAILTLAETDEELSERNITAVLEAAGADVSPSRVKAFVAALEGVDVDAVNARALAGPTPPDATARADESASPDRTAVGAGAPADASPAGPIDVEEAGAYGLDPYSPYYPDDATTSANDGVARDDDAATAESDDAATAEGDTAADAVDEGLLASIKEAVYGSDAGDEGSDVDDEGDTGEGSDADEGSDAAASDGSK